MKIDLIFRITMTVLWFLAAFINIKIVPIWVTFLIFTIAGLSLSSAIIKIINYSKTPQNDKNKFNF